LHEIVTNFLTTLVIFFIGVFQSQGQQLPSRTYNFTSEKEALKIIFGITDAVDLKAKF
jgi:hypothetical protein